MRRYIMCVLLLFSLAACQNEKVSETATKETPVQQGPSAVVSGGDTLRLSMGKPSTLNPLVNTDVSVDRVLRLMFEPLFVQNSNMEIEPNLAEGYTINGNSVDVKLRSGALWDDGSAITADDIVYSVDVLKASAANVIYKDKVSKVATCTKKDNLTATITYNEPISAVGYSLCFPIIPKEYYNSSRANYMRPVGNGLYKFSNYTLVKEMNLTASKNFNAMPSIKNVKVTIITDEATNLSALENNVIDALAIDTSNINKIPADMAANAAVYSTNKFEFLGLNLKKKPFSDINARQALAHLMPTKAIVDNIYIGKATASITPINPLNGYVSGIGVDNYDYDETIANTLIMAGGLTKSDFTFTILVNNDNAVRKEIANTISKSFNANGLNTKVEAVAYEQYAERLSKGEYDAFVGGVELKDNMDLSNLLMSSATAENNGINYFGYSDANMDRLIGLCKASRDTESYKTSINELNKYCSSQLPLLGICFKSEALVSNSRVVGVKTPTNNNVFGNTSQWTLK